MFIEIPDVTVVRETVTDGFRGVDDTAAADSKNKIYIFFFTEFNTFINKGKARIWNNAAQFYVRNRCFIKGCLNAVEQTGADNTAASVVN